MPWCIVRSSWLVISIPRSEEIKIPNCSKSFSRRIAIISCSLILSTNMKPASWSFLSKSSRCRLTFTCSYHRIAWFFCTYHPSWLSETESSLMEVLNRRFNIVEIRDISTLIAILFLHPLSYLVQRMIL